MSARRTKRRTRKSSIKNSPLDLSHGTRKKSTVSEAFVFECKSMNSSLSSVFTDSEQIEEKNKNTSRKKKVRQNEDLTHLLDAGSKDSVASSAFTDSEQIGKKKNKRGKKIIQTEDLTHLMDMGSTDSVSDSDPTVKKDEISVVSLASATKRTKNRRKPIFTLPDITNSLKSDTNDSIQNTTVKKVGRKKKIRYTEDLNAIANDRKDSDVTSKTKSKKTKRARVPSFLPSVDMMEPNKKVDSSKSAESTDSDNKENDTNTETTDNEEFVKKTRRGRSRKNKKKVAENKFEKVPHNTGEAIDIRSANETKESNSEVDDDSNSPQKRTKNHGTLQRNSRLRQANQTKDHFNLSSQNSIIEITNGSDNSQEDELTKKDRTEIEDSVILLNEETQNDIGFKNKPVGRRNSTRNNLDISKSHSAQGKTDKHSKINDENDIDNTSTNKRKSKRNISDFSNMESFSCPDKSQHDNNIENELINVSSVILQEHDEDHDILKSSKKSAKRSTFDIPSNIEVSLTKTERRQTRNRPSVLVESGNISKSQSKQAKKDQHCEINNTNDIENTSTSKRKSKKNMSDLSNLGSFGCLDRNSNTNNIENELTNVSSVILQEPDEGDSTVNSSKKSAKRSTFEIPSNRQESSTKADRRATRNGPSSEQNTSAKIPLKASLRGNNQSVMILDASSNNPNAGSPRKSTRSSRTALRSSTFEVDVSKGKPPILRREGTFEISSINQQEFNEMSGLQELSVTGTYNRPRSLKTSSSDEADVTIVDLTESVTDGKVPTSSGSSFDVSFSKVKRDKKSSEAILDHLNVTRRDSRKSKKSSSGMKLSTGTNDENVKQSRSFVTLKRGCHTMIDFDTGNSDDDVNGFRNGRGDLKKFRNFENLTSKNLGGNKVLLKDESLQEASETSTTNTNIVKKPGAKRSILKKSGANRRDTFEIAECFYASIEQLQKSSKAKPSVPVIKETDQNVSVQSEGPRDIFDVVSNTPTIALDKTPPITPSPINVLPPVPTPPLSILSEALLQIAPTIPPPPEFRDTSPTEGKFMLGSGESLIASQSFLQDTVNQSTMPRLRRTSTFTKNEEEKISTPPRKSLRKRWSQVERTPIFGKLPSGDSSIISEQPANASMNISKSVQFVSPLELTSKKQLQSTLRTSVRKTRTSEKSKKSVKIESPLKTPTIRLHSPLVMKKTPGPNFSAAENSIISGNCAFKQIPKLSPPSSTSTPFQKKKGISLLQKVLTSGKNKSNNVSGKSCPRTKMPNFSKIHQRQFEKMENLKEMQERKAARAQFLLSGSKPPPNTSAPGNTERESRKQLQFSPLKKEPLKSNIVKPKSASKDVSKPLSKPLQHMLKKRASLEKKKREIKSKVPIPAPAPKPTIATQKTEPKALKKAEPKGFTRFGFKLAPGKENITKEEQIKAIATKSKLPVDRTEKNRNQLGGVRSNRRFELLMKMRQNKKS